MEWVAPPRIPRLRGSSRRILDSPVDLIEVSDDDEGESPQEGDGSGVAVPLTPEATRVWGETGPVCVGEEITSSTWVDAEASPSSLSSSSGASPTVVVASRGESPQVVAVTGTEDPAPDLREEGAGAPSAQDEPQPEESDRDPWRPISPRTVARYAGVENEPARAHSPWSPLSASLGDPEEEVVCAVAAPSDEDIFGERELRSPSPVMPQEEVSYDEESEEVGQGLPLVAVPRRARRASSSSSGSPSGSPPGTVLLPVELSSAAEVLPTDTRSALQEAPPRRHRRRRRHHESDSSLSSGRQPRRRRRIAVPILTAAEVESASLGSGVVPPSSPAAIITVPGMNVGPMSVGAGSLYRTALRRLLRLAPVPRSGRSGDEDPESDPDSEDGWFMTVVTVLESYRTRPSSRTGRGRQRVAGMQVPRNLTELLSGVERPFSGGWAAIPPGFVSEWFPRRPRTVEGGWEGCSACQETDARERVCRESARALWREEVDRNSRPEASGRGAFLWADRSTRPQVWIPLASHSCDLGREVHFPLVYLSSQNLAAVLPGPEAFGVQLRVVLHFGIPSGLMIRWRTAGHLRAVFPLAGVLRRYWGRALLVEGDLEVTGDSSGHRSGVVVRGAYAVSVNPRFPRLLRHFPLEIAGTVYRGFRWDATLLGASLRWLPPRRVTATEAAEYPREVSVEVLSAALDSADAALSSWVPESQSARDRRRAPRNRPARDPSSEED